MKFKLFALTEAQRYRWMVLARCLLAVFAGFAIANLTVPVIGLAFSRSLALATFTGLLLSFVVWLVYIIYVFSARDLARIVYITTAILLVQIVIVTLLKFMGAS